MAALNRLPADVQAGERWHMTVRLKAPHGSRNPHGFDYELWLWEQGVQATGYVRATARDPVPVLLGADLAPPGGAGAPGGARPHLPAGAGPPFAGMIAALVVGDQTAIDRVDWDVFRATGVAHLVSISGLHITMFAWGAALLVGWLWRRSGRLCIALPAPQCGAGRWRAAGHGLCGVQRLGRAGAAHLPDAGHRGAAAPVGCALALAAWSGCWPAPWWWRSTPGPCCKPGSGSALSPWGCCLLQIQERIMQIPRGLAA